MPWVEMSGYGENVGKRVEVWNGDKSEHLGYGTLVGTATIYAWMSPDGTSLQSLSNPEERPSPEQVPAGVEVMESPENPKIELDDGRIVYGCQVYWRPVEFDPEMN